MHHSIKKISRAFLLMTTLTFTQTVHAEPSEVSEYKILRTLQSGMTFQNKFFKNAYRQETYEDTETYYEDVPYETTETYTDYEDYTENEYICHDETSYENQCHTETECDLSILRQRDPGVGPTPYVPPEPEPERPTPYEPPPEPYHPPQTCHEQNVCENVPVTHQECGYENVTHSRPVTRTRTVIKYDRVAHTRPVTRIRDIFDHQWSISAQIQFPAEAILLDQEKENITIELDGSESNPEFSLILENTIFGYEIASQQVINGEALIVLKMIPKYKSTDLGQKTIQNLQVIPTQNGLSFSFIDNVQKPRVLSFQHLVIVETVSQTIVADSEVQKITQKNQQGQLAINLDMSKNYEAILKIHREGLVIDSAVVDFEIRQPLQLKIDLSTLKDPNQLSATIVGQQSDAQLLLVDKTAAYANVSTKYVISLVRKEILNQQRQMSQKTFSRTSLVANKQGQYNIALKDLGINKYDLENYITSGDQVNVVIEVNRVTPDGKKIQFWKDNWITIK